MFSAHIKNNHLWTSLTMRGQENSPAQPGGGADDGSMMSIQERQRSFPLPHFSFNYKTVAQEFLRALHFSSVLTCPLVNLTSFLS